LEEVGNGWNIRQTLKKVQDQPMLIEGGGDLLP